MRHQQGKGCGDGMCYYEPYSIEIVEWIQQEYSRNTLKMNYVYYLVYHLGFKYSDTNRLIFLDVNSFPRCKYYYKNINIIKVMSLLDADIIVLADLNTSCSKLYATDIIY